MVEFARDVLGIKDAISAEVNPNAANPVIDLMEEQKSTTIKGGTMRLGAYDCKLDKNSLAYRIYGSEMISERHRHRYEFNNAYLDRMEAAGLKATGKNPDTGLVEIVEIPTPQPIFVKFVEAAMAYREKKK